MIKSFSLAAMAVLVMVGCNSGSNDTPKTTSFVEKNAKVATISGVKSIGNNTENISIKSISETSKDLDKRETSSTQLCQSGSMTFTGDGSSDNFSLDASNCKNEDSTINGAFHANISKASHTANMEVTRDLSVEDNEGNFLVKKGSKITASGTDTSALIKADFLLSANGEEIALENLSVAAEDQANDKISISFRSGKINIAGYYFEFVSQVKPFIVGDDGVESGLLRLQDGAGHKVEIDVESANNVAFKLDENGDGVFSENEIERENFIGDDFSF